MSKLSTPGKIILGGIFSVVGVGFNAGGAYLMKTGFQEAIDNYAVPYFGGGNNVGNGLPGIQPVQQALPQQQMPTPAMQEMVPNMNQPVVPSGKIN